MTVSNELKRTRKEATVAKFKVVYNPGICLERLRKTTKNLSGYQSPGRDFNPGPPEYEAEVLNTRTRNSVKFWFQSDNNKHFIRRPVCISARGSECVGTPQATLVTMVATVTCRTP
jgi:hypothetical protein